MKGEFFCYILKNDYESHKNRTYNGFTNNPKKRLRQHNGELVGGAKYTKNFGNNSWEIYALVKGFPDHINALQCECRIKHPNNKRKRSRQFLNPEGRIRGLNKVLKLEKWTNSSTIDNSTLKLKVWIKKEYSHLLTDLSDNIELNIVDEIDLDNLD
jgi:structure-specific endonuclease subunit SLX1